MSDSPWSQMSTPSSGLTVRKVNTSGNVEVYWAKDTRSRCLCVVCMPGDMSEAFQKNRVEVKGVALDLRHFEELSSQGLVLTLERNVDEDIFFTLCRALVEALDVVDEPAAALAVTLNHIRRWRSFLSGRARALLSAEQVRGLFAELSFLRQMIQSGVLTELDAVEAWTGPERGQQDFMFLDTAVEVKALSGRERNSVRISSEDQLESLKDRLFLKVFRLSDAGSSVEGESLNSLVRCVDGLLIEPDVFETFALKLAEAGYIQLSDYDNPVFCVAEEMQYRVEPSFPRLVRSEIPVGIMNVTYDLALESIEKFQCGENLLLED